MRRFLVLVIMAAGVSFAAAAPIEPCPVAKSCTQAFNVCKGNPSNTNCDGMLSDCKATGVVSGNQTKCTVPSRN
jgi:hypothetical protein